jgi:hypothetical protein
MKHWNAAKNVIKYVKGTANCGLKYEAEDDLQISVFTDSDWATDVDDRKSTSGYVGFIGRSPVSWKSSKQKSVSTSTMEAEYVALSLGVQEAIYMKKIYEELGIDSTTPMIYSDNQAAICHVKSDTNKPRTKHISVKYHFVKEKFEKNEIGITFVPSENNVADLFTKPLVGQKFHQHTKKLICN